MIEIKAPLDYARYGNRKIFLAGSIEMGTAVPWRHLVAEALEDEEVVLLNPRRDDWDNSWVQSIRNKQFKEQVMWELEGIDDAALVIVYFDPATTSPITLLELGYVVGRECEILVCCPDGFYRKGNVEILCNRHHVPLYNNMEEFLEDIVSYVRNG